MYQTKIFQQIKDMNETIQHLKNMGIQTKFDILNENKDHQILQISLKPGNRVYLKGKIIYSNIYNEQFYNKAANFRISSLLKNQIKLTQWINKQSNIQIIALTHQLKKGPILILNLSVYQESFYVNPKHIIVAKQQFQKQLKISPIDLFFKLEYKEKAQNFQDQFNNNQQIVFQANSPIIEKYLGESEFFCLYQGQILAISDTVAIQKKNHHFLLTGPGWVFFQTQKQTFGNKKPYSLAWLFIVIFFISLAFIQVQLVL